MKYILIAALITTTAQAGQWTQTQPTYNGGYSTWSPGYGLPVYTSPTTGGYSTYNPNPAPYISNYDVLRGEMYFDTIIRPHLDPRRR